MQSYFLNRRQIIKIGDKFSKWQKSIKVLSLDTYFSTFYIGGLSLFLLKLQLFATM